MIRRSLALVLFVMTISIIGPVGGASANGVCPAGTGTDVGEYVYGRYTVGVLCLSGTRVTFQALGIYRGMRKIMGLKICADKNGSPSNCVSNRGYFLYYAGPLTYGGCQFITAEMWNNTGTRIVYKTYENCN